MMPHLSSLLLSLGLAAAPFTAYGCDAGVFYGQNCTSAKAAAGDVAACNAWPLGAQAESTSTTLIWCDCQCPPPLPAARSRIRIDRLDKPPPPHRGSALEPTCQGGGLGGGEIG